MHINNFTRHGDLRLGAKFDEMGSRKRKSLKECYFDKITSYCCNTIIYLSQIIKVFLLNVGSVYMYVHTLEQNILMITLREI